MRTLFWDENLDALQMIDQRLLPEELKLIAINSVEGIFDAIKNMAVRGAPAIGATAAFGVAIAGLNINENHREVFDKLLVEQSSYLLQSRPTAVNLRWAVQRMLSLTSDLEISVDNLKLSLLNEAKMIADEDVALNKQMARHGAELIHDGDLLIHHCNTGSLAAVDWGTALGVIRMASELGKNIKVLVDETRPRLQGSRLTAWELEQYNIPYDIITDNAAGYFLSNGMVDKVLFGADRAAANGDVANKIGTYMLALTAHHNSVPTYAVIPSSTIDMQAKNGTAIPIEHRSPEEVLSLTFLGRTAHPKNATAINPAFDITPNELITGIVTEHGIIYPPYEKNFRAQIPGFRKV